MSRIKAEYSPALSNPTAATVFLRGSDATKPSYVRIPFDTGAVKTFYTFRVLASGLATTGTTSNFKATLQHSGNVLGVGAATAANNTDVCALTNRSLATITRPWRIDAIFSWDSTSQRLSGQWDGQNAETIEIASQATTAVTGVNLNLSGIQQDGSMIANGFVVSALFGTSNAANIATLSELTLEVL